jgi:hypothetical protein
MKIQAKLILLSLLAIIMLSSSDCNTNPAGPQIPVFSYLEPVINPPDTFQIAYNISTYGDKIANVYFKVNAVWLVEKLGAGIVTLKAVNDTSSLYIESKDTLALKGGKRYVFIVNNNNYTDMSNYFVQFTKLPLSYDSFEPKFK